MRRKLRYNLPSAALHRRIREAGRLTEGGEREMGFYLLDLKKRKEYRIGTCVTFRQYIRERTGLSPKKAADLVRVAEALEKLPPVPILRRTSNR
jgi:hypothetical protein